MSLDDWYTQQANKFRTINEVRREIEDYKLDHAEVLGAVEELRREVERRRYERLLDEAIDAAVDANH